MREIRRLGALAARVWCGSKLPPTPQELLSWETERIERLEGDPDVEDLYDLLTDEEKREIELACMSDIKTQIDLEGSVIHDRGYHLDHIWWKLWQILISFFAVNFPHKFPSGYEYAGGRYRETGLGIGQYSLIDDEWQNTAEDYAVCCDVLQALIDEKIYATASTKAWSVGRLQDALRISSQTLNRYAKAIAIPTPKRGESNFRYTHQQAMRIIKYTSQNGGTKAIREAASQLLKLED